MTIDFPWLVAIGAFLFLLFVVTIAVVTDLVGRHRAAEENVDGLEKRIEILEGHLYAVREVAVALADDLPQDARHQPATGALTVAELMQRLAEERAATP